MLTAEEARYGFATMMRMKTRRDKQAAVGASDLGNPCDRCVGRALAGLDRPALPIDPWWGAFVGTSIHEFTQSKLQKALAFDLSPQEQHSAVVEAVATMFRGAEIEKHVTFAEIEGYGTVGGSIDILADRTDLDLKNSTRQKSLVLQDWLAMNDPDGDGSPRWGVTGIKKKLGVTFEFEVDGKLIRGRQNTALAESKWAQDVADAGHKFLGYYGQQTLYMRSGVADNAILTFLNRDGTGIFDDPTHERYADKTAVHDLWVHEFPYDADFGDDLVNRAQAIFDYLQNGGLVGDLVGHENCFVEKLVAKDEADAAALDAPVFLTPEDAEQALAAARPVPVAA